MTIWPLLFMVSACDPAPALEGKRLFETGNFAQAEMHFRRALDERCDPLQRVADRINLAATLRERDAPAEALAILLAAKDVDRMPAETQIPYWNCLALIEEHAGHDARADAAYERALALLTPDTPLALAAQTLGNVGRLRMKQGRLREAEEALGPPGWLHDRPSVLDLNFAELRRLQGKPREAEDILRALLLRAATLPAQVRSAVANNLASLAAARGRHTQAEELWRYAIRGWREAYGSHHPIVAKGLNNLAAHLVARKRYADAEALYREALAMYPDAMLMNNLATLLHGRSRVAEAEALYRRSLDGFEKPAREAMQPHGNLAILLAATAREEEAIAQFQQVVQLLPLALPAAEPTAARYLESYELLLRKRREPAEAERIAALAMRYRVRAAIRAED